MTVHGLTRTAPLANGFRARFSYAPDTGLLVEWFPAPPRMVRCWTTRRRFMATYDATKRAFLREVSASIGASIDVSETCGEMEWIASS